MPSHAREFCHLIASARAGADALDGGIVATPSLQRRRSRRGSSGVSAAAMAPMERLIHVHIDMYAARPADTVIDVQFGTLTVVGNRDTIGALLEFTRPPPGSESARLAAEAAAAGAVQAQAAAQEAAERQQSRRGSRVGDADAARLPRDVVASDPECQRCSLQLTVRVRSLALVLNAECDNDASLVDPVVYHGPIASVTLDRFWMGFKMANSLMSLSAHLSRIIIHDLTRGDRCHVQVLGPTAVSPSAQNFGQTFRRMGPIQVGPSMRNQDLQQCVAARVRCVLVCIMTWRACVCPQVCSAGRVERSGDASSTEVGCRRGRSASSYRPVTAAGSRGGSHVPVSPGVVADDVDPPLSSHAAG